MGPRSVTIPMTTSRVRFVSLVIAAHSMHFSLHRLEVYYPVYDESV